MVIRMIGIKCIFATRFSFYPAANHRFHSTLAIKGDLFGVKRSTQGGRFIWKTTVRYALPSNLALMSTTPPCEYHSTVKLRLIPALRIIPPPRPFVKNNPRGDYSKFYGMHCLLT